MNSERYDAFTAMHYAAYRPPLHEVILDKTIEGKLDLGLDVGCGTGTSSIALASFCNKVIGVDPSEAMLKKAIAHPKVDYQIFDGKSLSFDSNQFDIITFAGSLFYAKSQKILDEVVRVGKPGSKILVYDFELFLDEILDRLGINNTEKGEIDYDHQINFSGLVINAIKETKNNQESVKIAINPSDLSHLLLSDNNNFELLHEKYTTDDLYNRVKVELEAISKNAIPTVRGNIYFTRYEILTTS